MFKVVLKGGGYRPTAVLDERFETHEMTQLFADDENQRLADTSGDYRWVVIETEAK